MEALRLIGEAMVPTLLLFGLFKKVNLSNVFCTAAIAFLSLFGLVFESMATFFCYLLLDSSWRNDKMPTEILFHHAGCSILTLIGLLIAVDLKDPIKKLVCGAISCLLNMEITSPFLHAAKAAKKKDSLLAAPLMAVLIVLWIPFRLIYPFLSIYNFYILYTLKTTWSVLICVNLVILLVAVQFMWFFRLCVLFKKEALCLIVKQNEIHS